MQVLVDKSLCNVFVRFLASSDVRSLSSGAGVLRSAVVAAKNSLCVRVLVIETTVKRIAQRFEHIVNGKKRVSREKISKLSGISGGANDSLIGVVSAW